MKIFLFILAGVGACGCAFYLYSRQEQKKQAEAKFKAELPSALKALGAQHAKMKMEGRAFAAAQSSKQQAILEQEDADKAAYDAEHPPTVVTVK